jgi:hypothetical protein
MCRRTQDGPGKESRIVLVVYGAVEVAISCRLLCPDGETLDLSLTFAVFGVDFDDVSRGLQSAPERGHIAIQPGFSGSEDAA